MAPSLNFTGKICKKGEKPHIHLTDKTTRISEKSKNPLLAVIPDAFCLSAAGTHAIKRELVRFHFKARKHELIQVAGHRALRKVECLAAFSTKEMMVMMILIGKLIAHIVFRIRNPDFLNIPGLQKLTYNAVNRRKADFFHILARQCENFRNAERSFRRRKNFLNTEFLPRIARLRFG